MVLSIVSVNYNTSKYLRQCLKSIEEFLTTKDFEIIISDNNSPDRDIEKLENEFKQVRFIYRKINDGFSGGCDAAVKVSSGKYLLFLNPDIRLIDNSLQKLLDYIDKDEKIGISSGLLVDETGKPMYCYDKFPDMISEISYLLGINQNNKRNIFNTNNFKNIPFEVDWFHGAFLLMRRKDYDLAGGFNKNYFMYYEDVELCYNFKNKLKKKIVCVPDVRIFHHTRSSISKEKIDNIYFFHMNRGKLLFIRNYPFLKKWIIHLIGLLSILIRVTILPFWNKYKNIRKEKFRQLSKIIKLYFSNSYLNSSKFEYIKTN